MSPLELTANAVATLSILLAARNHRHTWTTGVVSCLLFAVLFFQSQLYAETTLQAFFIATSLIGWFSWRDRLGGHTSARPVGRIRVRSMVWMLPIAAVVTLSYGGLLHHFTDAYLPFLDALVLVLSVIAQCLLMQRKLESWYFWLSVNTLSVPLFASRGLYLTAVLYAVYWFNAWYGWLHWRKAFASQATVRV